MKILISEDQPVAAVFLRRQLEAMGHEVTHSRDGLEAWEMLEASDIRLVITDWVMPRMDGLELCRRIRSVPDRPYTYVILVTARDRHEDRLEGLRAGADDFLAKPPDPSELAVRLEIARRILSVQEELERKNAQLAELATMDALTGVRNRRTLPDAFEAARGYSERQGLPLSAIMLDVDHFKHYNDDFGHPAGDTVLRTVAQILRSMIRAHDVAARYGGEEFVVLLPATEAADAGAIAERIRAAIEHHAWPHRPVTVSLGVASAPTDSSTANDLVEHADRALYGAKRSGRNCVGTAEALPGMLESRARFLH